MPNNFQIPSRTAKLLPGHDSGIHKHTHTHTDRVDSICPSAILSRGHKKISDVVTLGSFVKGTSHLLRGGGRFFFSRSERY